MKYFQPDLFGSDPKMRSRQFSKKFIDAVQSNFNDLETFEHFMLKLYGKEFLYFAVNGPARI
jgi:hypothetical protein